MVWCGLVFSDEKGVSIFTESASLPPLMFIARLGEAWARLMLGHRCGSRCSTPFFFCWEIDDLRRDEPWREDVLLLLGVSVALSHCASQPTARWRLASIEDMSARKSICQKHREAGVRRGANSVAA